MEPVTFTPIGTVRSPFKEPTGTPIHPRASQGAIGTVELLPEHGKARTYTFPSLLHPL